MALEIVLGWGWLVLLAVALWNLLLGFPTIVGWVLQCDSLHWIPVTLSDRQFPSYRRHWVPFLVRTSCSGLDMSAFNRASLF